MHLAWSSWACTFLCARQFSISSNVEGIQVHHRRCDRMTDSYVWGMRSKRSFQPLFVAFSSTSSHLERDTFGSLHEHQQHFRMILDSECARISCYIVGIQSTGTGEFSSSCATCSAVLSLQLHQTVRSNCS